eukprot:CAMPEP_0182564594 /NCGR_PEP_ID=MMETSP1324-20130603/6501_1 /TAXON_ID=236786 /ORGANISM="Florenciella sp., Strain RCC1587" /LENGTH=131 /DNA_ID=CAMNT_0024778079 /DNA_START=265 /DNA_END=660 /DNA_ORIENTATION=+
MCAFDEWPGPSCSASSKRIIPCGAHHVALPLRKGADVAAEDDVASECHAAFGPFLVERVRDNGGGQWKLDGRGVDDAHDVARPGALKDAEEGPVESVLGVKLYDLLVVVRALEQLDPCVERAAVGPEEDLD